MTKARDPDYRGHRVGAHRYATSPAGDLCAVHVDGRLIDKELPSIETAMKIGRAEVDRIEGAAVVYRQAPEPSP